MKNHRVNFGKKNRMFNQKHVLYAQYNDFFEHVTFWRHWFSYWSSGMTLSSSVVHRVKVDWLYKDIHDHRKIPVKWVPVLNASETEPEISWHAISPLRPSQKLSFSVLLSFPQFKMAYLGIVPAETNLKLLWNTRPTGNQLSIQLSFVMQYIAQLWRHVNTHFIKKTSLQHFYSTFVYSAPRNTKKVWETTFYTIV